MKNYLQFQFKDVYRILLSITVLFMLTTVASAQCNTKITDPNGDDDNKDFICGETVSQYYAVRDTACVGDTIKWSLSGGGTIVKVEDDDTVSVATVHWDDNPAGSGPYVLNITETDTNNNVTGYNLFVYAEVDNLVMACNDLVLVALDNNCHDTIGADKMIEDPKYPDDSYTVTVFNTDNTPRPEPVVSLQDLGDTLMVVVKHDCSGLACMGRIAFQDKLATMLSCREDTIKLECDEDTAPENPNVGFPLAPGSTHVKIDEHKYKATIPGDCGGEFTLVYKDEVQEFPFGGKYQLIINRTWAAIDASQNQWECTEVITKSWADFDSICAPPNYDGLKGRPYFQCNDKHPFDNSIYWPYPDLIPGPDITGYPDKATCGNIHFLYQDIEMPGCGYTRKILRHWIIWEWCTGRQKECDQVLVFVDKNPPVFHLPKDTIKFNSHEYDCFGDAYPLPIPDVDYECSGWTYEVLGYNYKGDGNCDYTTAHSDKLFKKDGRYGIKDLPVDTTVCVSYRVVDDCGYASTGNVLVVIKDNQKPTAACETHTAVTMSEGAKVFATSLDDDSWDNCGIVKYEIRRMTDNCGHREDLQFGEYINVCCEDVGKTVTVVLRVYDKAGLYSECMGEVNVVDKEKPKVTYCPPNFSIDCTEDYSHIFKGGKPVATDNCDDISITYVDVPHLNDCGLGYVNRTWTIKDASGLESEYKCRQVITVEDKHPLTENDIIWPADRHINGCWPDVDIDESVTGLPVINNTSCKSLGIAHDDKVDINPAGNDDACVVIHRQFTVADWCNEDTHFTYVQDIFINDGGAPVFTNCSDTLVFTDAACNADVTVKAYATDDCTDNSKLKYTYKVDKGNDGTYELSGYGNVVHTTFERGYNKVVFTVKDACNNTTTCTRIIRVKDAKPPTPQCLLKISTSLGTEGKVSINAAEFNHGSSDNCTPSNYGPCGCYTDLRFSFSTDVTDTLRTFDCSDLDNGVGQIFPLTVYVTDLDGNQDYCKVNLIVKDTKDVCPDAPNPTFAIRGTVFDDNEKGLPGFKIKGQSLELNDQKVTETANDGEYELQGLKAYQKYEIVPDKEDNVLDGVSTLDLVLIQKHILGIKKFDNPYLIIAADANDSKTISSSDILELRKLILGVKNELKIKKSWRIIQPDEENFGMDNPWDFREKFVTDSMYYRLDSVDFVAVKIGDINHNASVFETNGLNFRNEATEYLKAKNVIFGQSEQVEAEFFNEAEINLAGLQFTMEFDPAVLQVQSIKSVAVPLSPANYHIDNNKGTITFSWNTANELVLKENTLMFKVNFKSISSGILKEAIKLTSKITPAEIYNSALETSSLELRFDGEDLHNTIIYQNVPNPFTNTTRIVFELAGDDEVNFKLYDSSGKILINTHRHYSMGKNSITISKKDLGEAGIYFYKITTSNTSITKRMILIK